MVTQRYKHVLSGNHLVYCAFVDASVLRKLLFVSATAEYSDVIDVDRMFALCTLAFYLLSCHEDSGAIASDSAEVCMYLTNTAPVSYLF